MNDIGVRIEIAGFKAEDRPALLGALAGLSEHSTEEAASFFEAKLLTSWLRFDVQSDFINEVLDLEMAKIALMYDAEVTLAWDRGYTEFFGPNAAQREVRMLAERAAEALRDLLHNQSIEDPRYGYDPVLYMLTDMGVDADKLYLALNTLEAGLGLVEEEGV